MHRTSQKKMSLPGAAMTALGACACILARLSAFQRAYSEHQQHINDEALLRAQCDDPAFIATMRRHAHVCDDARALFQQSPLLVGLQAMLAFELPKIGWEAVAILALLVLAASIVLLPYLRAYADRRDRDRILEACSPDLPQYWRVVPRRRVAHQCIEDAE